MPPEIDEAAETEMDAAASVADASRRVIERNEPRNFILLALYQIVHRVKSDVRQRPIGIQRSGMPPGRDPPAMLSEAFWERTVGF